MTTDCSLNHVFSTWLKIPSSEHVMYTNCFLFCHSEQFMYTTCSEIGIFLYWTCDSMNNLLSYCWLVEIQISASKKDLLGINEMHGSMHKCWNCPDKKMTWICGQLEKTKELCNLIFRRRDCKLVTYYCVIVWFFKDCNLIT